MYIYYVIYIIYVYIHTYITSISFSYTCLILCYNALQLTTTAAIINFINSFYISSSKIVSIANASLSLLLRQYISHTLYRVPRTRQICCRL